MFKDKTHTYYVGIVGILFSYLLAWNLFPHAWILLVVSVLIAAFDIWKNPMHGIFIALFFLPFTKVIGLPSAYDKLSVSEILFVYTCAVFLIQRKITIPDILGAYSKHKWIVVALCSFIFFAAISIFNAVSIKTWALEVSIYLYLAGFFSMLVLTVTEEKQLNQLLQTLLYSFSIVVFIGFVGWGLTFTDFYNPFAIQGRVTSTFKMPNQFSISIIVIFSILLGNTEQARKYKRWILYGLYISAVIVFFSTGSRITPYILCVVMGGTAIVYYIYSKQYPKISLIAFSFTLLLIINPFGLSKYYGSQNYTRIFSEDADPERQNIEYEIPPAQNVFMEHLLQVDTARYQQIIAFERILEEEKPLLLGIGAGNFFHKMPHYIISPRSWEMHNTVLGLLIEIGIGGLIGFISLLFAILSFSLKHRFSIPKQKILLVALLLTGIFGHLLFGIVHYGVRNRFFWLGLALVVIIVNIYSQQKKNHQVAS